MKNLSLLFFFVLITSSSFSQKIIGTWNGSIDINGNNIPIVFHFYKDSSGKIDGKWDSPKQNAMNLPFSSINFNDDSIHLEIKMISGFYEGKFSGIDSMAGTWHQGGGELPLSFHKDVKETYVPAKRPQTPQPPFNYEAHDVTYYNADKSIEFGATFTEPASSKKNEKFPVVLLITGSGKQDRDENIFDHKPFAVIADYLTKRGIAVLRVDDRGIGKTTGDFDTSSSADFARDVEAGINYLKTRADVDRKHIGLIGHSEGGMIAAMVAARDKDVSFMVMLAGTGVKGSDINDFQNIFPLRASGANEKIIQHFLDLHHALVKVATTEEDMQAYTDAISKSYYQWKQRQSPETLQILVKGTDDEVIGSLQRSYAAFRTKWWKFFLQHDPAEDLEKLSIPVLALNGDKDIQVDATINLAAVNNALKKSKSKNYQVKELRGLNHLFQHCTTCTIEEYNQLEETFSPEALKIMGDWLSGVIKGERRGS